MARIKLYRNKRDGAIYLRLNHNQTHAERRLPISVPSDQWLDGRVVGGKNRDALNAQLSSILANAQTELFNIVRSRPTRNMSAAELRDLVCREVLNEVPERKDTFFSILEDYIKKQKPGTAGVYQNTLSRLSREYPTLDFDDITKDWLLEHRARMIEQGYSTSYIQMQERNIRCIVNIGIDKELTTLYAFRKFSVMKTQSNVRDISADELAHIATAELDEKHARYRDLFMLQFYLIGINLIDLYHLKESDVRHGRIHYTRQKTGRQYNIKIEPEAAAIIHAHKSTKEGRLLDFFDNCTSYRTTGFNRGYTIAMQETCKELGIKQRITSYVTRYSWATIASEDLHISVDAISKALGHSFGLKVTTGYINTRDLLIIDEANRAVLDHVKRFT